MAANRMMTKARLVKHLAERFGFTRAKASAILEELAVLAAKEVRRGFRFPGIGSIVLHKRRARMGRQPQTGEVVRVPARSQLQFRLSRVLKEAALPQPAEFRPQRSTPATAGRAGTSLAKSREAPGRPTRTPSSEGKAPPRQPTYSVVPVWYATDRAPTAASAPARRFGAERGELSFGVCEVSIPRDHKLAKLESPSVLRLEFREDPERHVVLLRVQPLDWAQCREQIRAGRSEQAERQILVFVHGYNTTFADAVRRTAQITYDLTFDGAAFAYTWPSEGRLAGYLVDENNVAWTQHHLAHVLECLRTECGARTVHLIAHSMGNRALSQVLAGLTPDPADGAGRAALQQVVLTAPDIDAGVFRELAAQMAGKAARITLYASSKDKALVTSRKIHKYVRAGEGGRNVTVVPGIDTVDVSTLDTGLTGHHYFGDNKSVISDMFYLVRHGLGPHQRHRLASRTQGALRYWVFVKAKK